MRIDLVNLRPAGLTAAAPSLLSEWRVGAVLDAIAVRDVRSGQLWLDIGGQRHPARVASAREDGPEHGEKLQVRVLRNSPVLALETLSAAKPAPAADAAVLADALRRYVPRQESPALALANLAWLAQDQDAGKRDASALPRAVVQAAMQLWRSLPTAQSLSQPAALETAIQRSGAFFESTLAAGAAADRDDVAADLKGLLLTLNKALREAGARPEAARTDNAPPPTPLARGPLTTLAGAPATFAVIDGPERQLNELARQTDGALARITTTQLASTAPEAATPLLIELPVRHDDRASMLRLRIERDGSRAQTERGDAWTVEAAMDLGAPGALHARVTLTARRIGVQLRAETPAIVDALAARAHELEALLRESGLEVDRVVCLHGLPAGDAGARGARLLDVRA